MTTRINAVAANSALKDAKLEKACREFEAVFVRYLLQKMRESVPRDGIEGSSSERELYESMLDTAMADSISQQGQMGLADLLYQQVSPDLGGPKDADASGQVPDGSQQDR